MYYEYARIFKSIFVPVSIKIKQEYSSIDIIKYRTYCNNFIDKSSKLYFRSQDDVYAKSQKVFNKEIFNRINDERMPELANEILQLIFDIDKKTNQSLKKNTEKLDDIEKRIYSTIEQVIENKTSTSDNIIEVYFDIIKLLRNKISNSKNI